MQKFCMKKGRAMYLVFIGPDCFPFPDVKNDGPGNRALRGWSSITGIALCRCIISWCITITAGARSLTSYIRTPPPLACSSLVKYW